MSEDEDPIVGSGAANKSETRTEGNNANSVLPAPTDDDDVDRTVGKHRKEESNQR
jgi:hypothetical protein